MDMTRKSYWNVGHGVLLPMYLLTFASFSLEDESGRMYLDTCHPGKTPEEIKGLCQFDLDITRVKGEALPPTREELHLIHEVLDPEQIFIPKVKKA